MLFKTFFWCYWIVSGKKPSHLHLPFIYLFIHSFICLSIQKRSLGKKKNNSILVFETIVKLMSQMSLKGSLMKVYCFSWTNCAYTSLTIGWSKNKLKDKQIRRSMDWLISWLRYFGQSKWLDFNISLAFSGP